MDINKLSELCINYLGVDKKELPSFLLRKKRILDSIINKYGEPLSETCSDLSAPLDYSNGVEFMLAKDFGKYAGTQSNVEVVEQIGNIIIYKFM